MPGRWGHYQAQSVLTIAVLAFAAGLTIGPWAACRDRPASIHVAGGGGGKSAVASLLPPPVTAADWAGGGEGAPAPFIVVTAARVNASKEALAARDEEYAWGLSWVASTGLRAAVVVAEAPEGTPWPVVDAVPWAEKAYFTSKRGSKSAKESDGIRHLVSRLAALSPPLADDAMIVKISGRYRIVRDDVLRAIKADPSADFVYGIDETGHQARTFCFALKWRHFKRFYSAPPLDILEGTNVEQLIYNLGTKPGMKAVRLPKLWIIGNIAGENSYTLF